MSVINIASKDEWAAAIASQIVSLGVQSVSADFAATIDRRDLHDDFRITRIASGQASIQRSAANITSADDGFAIFHLNYRGAGYISQHGRTCKLDGLSAALYTTDKPSQFRFVSRNDGVLVQMPRDLLPVASSELRHVLVRPVGHDPLLRVLLAFLESSHQDLPGMEPTHKALVSTTLLDLIAGILRVNKAQSRGHEYQLLVRVQDYVERHFADPSLNVPALAHHFNVSTRSIYGTFAKVGLRPAEHIRAVRLRRARKLVENTDIPMDSVSSACGFGDLSTFVRAFKRAHSVSPTAWRIAHQSRQGRV
ncbi:MAG: helix-turn-helix domain-containing protein [Mycobacterium sp.]